MGCSSIKTIVRSNNSQQKNINTHVNSNEQKRYYQMSPNQFYGSKNNYNEDEF